MLDITVSFFLLVFSPIIIWVQENKIRYFSNIFQVILGSYSWVGYGKFVDKTLPQIKPSVLSPLFLVASLNANTTKQKLINLQYAKDYSIEKDLHIIWNCLKKLGS